MYVAGSVYTHGRLLTSPWSVLLTFVHSLLTIIIGCARTRSCPTRISTMWFVHKRTGKTFICISASLNGHRMRSKKRRAQKRREAALIESGLLPKEKKDTTQVILPTRAIAQQFGHCGETTHGVLICPVVSHSVFHLLQHPTLLSHSHHLHSIIQDVKADTAEGCSLRVSAILPDYVTDQYVYSNLEVAPT